MDRPSIPVASGGDSTTPKSSNAKESSQSSPTKELTSFRSFWSKYDEQVVPRKSLKFINFWRKPQSRCKRYIHLVLLYISLVQSVSDNRLLFQTTTTQAAESRRFHVVKMLSNRYRRLLLRAVAHIRRVAKLRFPKHRSMICLYTFLNSRSAGLMNFLLSLTKSRRHRERKRGYIDSLEEEISQLRHNTSSAKREIDGLQQEQQQLLQTLNASGIPSGLDYKLIHEQTTAQTQHLVVELHHDEAVGSSRTFVQKGTPVQEAAQFVNFEDPLFLKQLTLASVDFILA